MDRYEANAPAEMRASMGEEAFKLWTLEKAMKQVDDEEEAERLRKRYEGMLRYG